MGAGYWQEKPHLFISPNVHVLLHHSSFPWVIFLCKWNVYPLSLKIINYYKIPANQLHTKPTAFLSDISKGSGALFEKFLFEWYLITHLLLNCLLSTDSDFYSAVTGPNPKYKMAFIWKCNLDIDIWLSRIHVNSLWWHASRHYPSIWLEWLLWV